MTNFLLVARVESRSHPGRAYEVKTDGARLTCPCGRWTRVTHTPWCAELGGGKCDCKESSETKPARTCRHVRDIEYKIARAGGLSRIMGMLRRGDTFTEQDALHLPTVQPEPVAASTKRSGRRATPVVDMKQAEQGPHWLSGSLDWVGGGRAIILED